VLETATILRIISAFAVVALMLYAFAVVARYRMRSTAGLGNDRLISVIETTHLPQAGALHVVKVGERYHVIGTAGGGISILSEIEPSIVERRVAARTGRMRLWPL
jgi:flagellar biogenesis protein FliO